MIDNINLLDCNPEYVTVEHKDVRHSLVSLRYLAPRGVINKSQCEDIKANEELITNQPRKTKMVNTVLNYRLTTDHIISVFLYLLQLKSETFLFKRLCSKIRWRGGVKIKLKYYSLLSTFLTFKIIICLIILTKCQNMFCKPYVKLKLNKRSLPLKFWSSNISQLK